MISVIMVQSHLASTAGDCQAHFSSTNVGHAALSVKAVKQAASFYQRLHINSKAFKSSVKAESTLHKSLQIKIGIGNVLFIIIMMMVYLAYLYCVLMFCFKSWVIVF